MGATKNGDSEYVDILGEFGFCPSVWAIWVCATVLQGPMGGLQGGMNFWVKDKKVDTSPERNPQKEDELPERRGGAV